MVPLASICFLSMTKVQIKQFAFIRTNLVFLALILKKIHPLSNLKSLKVKNII